MNEVRRSMVVLPGGQEVVDAVVGYRAWEYKVNAGKITLVSLYTPTVWHPHTPLRKECVCSGPVWRRRHRCGIYAWRDPHRPSGVFLEGEVYLWGDVRVHERGYRAEYAMPAAFYMPAMEKYIFLPEIESMFVEMAAEQYGVPLVQRPPVTSFRQRASEDGR